MSRNAPARFRSVIPGAALLFAAVLLLGCAVRLVSPYSPDLQKRAADMVAEVAAWDVSMQTTTGPINVDDVQKTLAKWNGEVVAMASIAASLDPGIVRCDRLVGKVMGGVTNLLPKDLRGEIPPNQPSPTGQPNAPPQGCEAGIFTMMASDLAELRELLAAVCGFGALGQPTARPASPPQPRQIAMSSQCRALFGGAMTGQNGPAVDSLLRDLNAVVYIEGRKKPPPAK